MIVIQGSGTQTVLAGLGADVVDVVAGADEIG